MIRRATSPQFVLVGGGPHALAAAARARLDHHRIADLLGNPGRLSFAFDHPEMPRHGRDFGGSSSFL